MGRYMPCEWPSCGCGPSPNPCRSVEAALAERRAAGRVMGEALGKPPAGGPSPAWLPLAFAAVLGLGIALTAVARRPATPDHQPPVSMRCFPPGTVLPFQRDFFGRQHPAIPGCPDYRLNEGMET